MKQLFFFFTLLLSLFSLKTFAQTKDFLNLWNQKLIAKVRKIDLYTHNKYDKEIAKLTLAALYDNEYEKLKQGLWLSCPVIQQQQIVLQFCKEFSIKTHEVWLIEILNTNNGWYNLYCFIKKGKIYQGYYFHSVTGWSVASYPATAFKKIWEHNNQPTYMYNSGGDYITFTHYHKGKFTIHLGMVLDDWFKWVDYLREGSEDTYISCAE